MQGGLRSAFARPNEIWQPELAYMQFVARFL